jgi:DnaK suppressor protein
MIPGPELDLASLRAAAARVVDDLRGELAAISESTAAGPDDEHDAEGSTVGYERARVAALLLSAEAALARLDDAIARLRGGRYGRCLVCHDEIAEERLLALPGVDRCTDCTSPRSAHPLR